MKIALMQGEDDQFDDIAQAGVLEVVYDGRKQGDEVFQGNLDLACLK